MKSLRFLAATWLFCALFTIGAQTAAAFSLSEELSKLQATLQSFQSILSSAVGSGVGQTAQISNSTSVSGSTATTAPSLTLTINPTALTLGSRAAISWSAKNVSSCTASGAWTGTKLLSGTISTGIFAVTGTRNYTLTCSGRNGTIARTVSLAVTASSTSGTTVSTSYGLSDVKSVTKRSIDPIPTAVDDEYVLYTILLNNGTVHEVRSCGFCTTSMREQAFRNTGYTGDVSALMKLAVETPVSCPVYQIPRCTTGYVVVPGGVGSNGCQLAPKCELASTSPATSTPVTVPALNFTVRNLGLTATTSFSLNNGCLGYEIDWGDGKKDNFFGGNGPMCTMAVTAVNKAHTYNQTGNYTIKVTPYFGTTAGTPQSKVVSITSPGTTTSRCTSGNQTYAEGATLQTIVNADGTSRTITDARFVCRNGQWATDGSLPGVSTTTTTRVVTTSNVNVRSTPNGFTLGTKVAGSLGYRAASTIVAGGYSWVYVNFDTSPDGYVASQYLSTTIPGTTPSVGGMTREQIISRLQELQAEIVRLQALLTQM